MRQSSAAARTILALDNFVFAYIVDLGTTMHHTTIQQDLVVGDVTYLGNNKLLNVQPPRLSAVVDREAYQISYADSDFEFRALFEAGFAGAFVQVRIVFLNTTIGALGGVAPGEWMTNEEDIIIAYKGLVDNQAYSINWDGEVIATVEASSPMGSLERIRGMYTSKDSIKEVNAVDTCFDLVYEGSGPISLLWGKI